MKEAKAAGFRGSESVHGIKELPRLQLRIVGGLPEVNGIDHPPCDTTFKRTPKAKKKSAGQKDLP